MTTGITIESGWVAFVKDDKYYGYHEFKNGGKYFGSLTLITKPTETELLFELADKGITLFEPENKPKTK